MALQCWAWWTEYIFQPTTVGLTHEIRMGRQKFSKCDISRSFKYVCVAWPSHLHFCVLQWKNMPQEAVGTGEADGNPIHGLESKPAAWSPAEPQTTHRPLKEKINIYHCKPPKFWHCYVAKIDARIKHVYLKQCLIHINHNYFRNLVNYTAQ